MIREFSVRQILPKILEIVLRMYSGLPARMPLSWSFFTRPVSQLRSIFLRIGTLLPIPMARVGGAFQDGSDPCRCRTQSEKFCRGKIQSRGGRRRMEAQNRARQSLRGDHRGSFPGGGRSYCDGPRQQKHGRTAIKKQHYGIGEQGRAVSGSFYRYNSVCRPFCWVEGASVEGVFSNLLSGTKRAGSIGRCTR
jgi:hypothetical protein